VPGDVRRKGEHLLAKLHGLEDTYPGIRDVRGRGLLCAVEFESDVAERITLDCLQNGLLINQLKPNLIRFSPPLVVSDAEIEQAVRIVTDVLNRLTRKQPVASE
jgi:acetylornithine/N-succinyldiaminopimelate aminotransferase